VYRARRQLDLFKSLNTIQSRASWLRLEFLCKPPGPLRSGVDVPNQCPMCVSSNFTSPRCVFYLILLRSGINPVRLMYKLKMHAATVMKIPEHIGRLQTLISIKSTINHCLYHYEGREQDLKASLEYILYVHSTC
jgi:hypothetical protein